MMQRTTTARSLSWGLASGFTLLLAGLAGAQPRPGDDWAQLDCGVAATLYALDFVSSREGFAAGFGFDTTTFGGIAATVDAGQTWTSLLTQEGIQIFGVAAREDLLLAVGHDIETTSGLVLRSTDRGQTWSQQVLAETFGLYDVVILNDTRIVACGYDGSIYRSSDAGVTWTRSQAGGQNAVLRDLSFVDENVGYALGGQNPFQPRRIFRTLDGGATWSLAHGFTTQTILSKIHFFADHPLGSRTGLAAGWQGGVETVLQTVDGGLTWTPVMQTLSGNVLQTLAVQGQHCWAAGISGETYGSSDYGQTWTTVSGPAAFVLSTAVVDGGLYCGSTLGLVYRTRFP